MNLETSLSNIGQTGGEMLDTDVQLTVSGFLRLQRTPIAATLFSTSFYILPAVGHGMIVVPSWCQSCLCILYGRVG